MIRIGMNKEELDVARIGAATFHPRRRDEWYVVSKSETGQPIVVTFTNGVCGRIEAFSTMESAMDAYFDKWNDDAEKEDVK